VAPVGFAVGGVLGSYRWTPLPKGAETLALSKGARGGLRSSALLTLIRAPNLKGLRTVFVVLTSSLAEERSHVALI
jgi:hypothetical protein